uniref:Uncharacterized protein n=1 Tax=Leviviridae sp. TaxID=2027243 RepID=A0A514D2L6_9VIRU|nr:MAG: hypothetical protein H2RhizoLitter49830_000001 [Leviviridae sp.]
MVKTAYPWTPVNGTQETVSSGHPWLGHKASKTSDIGGDFYTQKKWYAGFPQNISLEQYQPTIMASDWAFRVGFNGSILPCHPGGLAFPPASISSDSRLNQLGAQAISKAKPTLTKVDTAAFLGELREGFPRISLNLLEVGVKSALNRIDAWHVAKAAGEEHLNIEFGWKPLISDLAKLSVVVETYTDLIRQWNRDAGKVVRRRWSFPSEVQASSAVSHSAPPYIGETTDSSIWFARTGNIVRSRTIKRDVWFSGAFLYFTKIPLDKRADGLEEYVQKARHLMAVLNLEPDPDTLWQLAPWSWAVDWFSNVGDIVSNFDSIANDGLVVRYGYLMEHTIVEDSYVRQLPNDTIYSGAKPVPVTSSLSLFTETKTRRRANPFGFGVSWDGLSPKQLSIAAALGITRS